MIIAGATAALALAGGLDAAEPAPFPDFTFKRVKPPEAGTRKFITIQIAPDDQPAAAPPTANHRSDLSAPAVETPADLSDWFWSALSPDLSAAAPGRFDLALNALAHSPDDVARRVPRLDQLRTIALEHGTEILLSTIGHKVSPALVLAMIGAESGGRATVVSGAGAQGLMQLMPATASRFGVEDPLDPAQNLKGGVAYLDWLIAHFDGDPILALAAYNAGENAVAEAGGVPAWPETRAYVPKVVAAFQVARALCMTPPELYSDGCVFALGK